MCTSATVMIGWISLLLYFQISARFNSTARTDRFWRSWWCSLSCIQWASFHKRKALITEQRSDLSHVKLYQEDICLQYCSRMVTKWSGSHTCPSYMLMCRIIVCPSFYLFLCCDTARMYTSKNHVGRKMVRVWWSIEKWLLVLRTYLWYHPDDWTN